MERVDEVVASLNELRALGVRCSIDDFGTGYSALTYLAEMPIDAIKIDRSFIQRIDGEASGASDRRGRHRPRPQPRPRRGGRRRRDRRAAPVPRRPRLRPGPGLSVQPAGPRRGDRRAHAHPGQGVHRMGNRGRRHCRCRSRASPRLGLEALLESIMLERHLPSRARQRGHRGRAHRPAGRRADEGQERPAGPRPVGQGGGQHAGEPGVGLGRGRRRRRAGRYRPRASGPALLDEGPPVAFASAAVPDGTEADAGQASSGHGLADRVSEHSADGRAASS